METYRKPSLLIFALFILICSCTTIKPNISKTYKKKSVDRDGDFTFKSKIKLTLYSDSTYLETYEHSDGEGGLSMNINGTYKIIVDTLQLIPELEGFNNDLKYIIRNNKLLYRDTDGSLKIAFK